MANDWTATDYAAIATAIDGGTYTAGTANWLGMRVRGPDPEPEPTNPPSVYCLWQLEPQEIISDFGTGRPVVRYALVFEIHRQEGAGRGHVFTLEGEIRTRLKAVTGTSEIHYVWKGGQPVPIGKIGNWDVEQLTFVTYGGAQ